MPKAVITAETVVKFCKDCRSRISKTIAPHSDKCAVCLCTEIFVRWGEDALTYDQVPPWLISAWHGYLANRHNARRKAFWRRAHYEY